MKQDKSCAIIGAGCAGLSLALELAKKNVFDRVLIFEAEKTLQAKQTWCYWNTASHLFEHCVSHQWSKWLVRRGDQLSFTHSARYSYQHLPSSAFFSWIKEELSRYPHVLTYMQTKVENLKENKEQVDIETSQGNFQAPLVFDSRIPSDQLIKADLIQHFHGWTIETEKSAFDPYCVTLMDFFPCQEGVHFFYVLPFSCKEALVESTYFSSYSFEPARYEKDLVFYLKKRYGLTNYQIVRKEKGILPMQVDYGRQASLGKKILPIGTSAGWLKPSTGYGFLAIQRGVKRLVESLIRQKNLKFSHVQPFPFRWLDQTFLSFIQADLSHADAVFYQLFTSVPADILIRFLGECASLSEIICVMKSLPKKALLKHLMSS